MRLTASADPNLWAPVSWPSGLRGRRHRKAAFRLMTAQTRRAFEQAGGPGPALGWLVERLAPRTLMSANGTRLVWSWKADPDLLAAMAGIVELTPQVRTARAMMPMEYDDTESFPTALGVGEKLFMPVPPKPEDPPFVTYTWDTGTHLVTLTGFSGDRERFGTTLPALDDLARSIRIADDLTTGESGDVLRLPPA